MTISVRVNDKVTHSIRQLLSYKKRRAIQTRPVDSDSIRIRSFLPDSDSDSMRISIESIESDQPKRAKVFFLSLPAGENVMSNNNQYNSLRILDSITDWGQIRSLHLFPVYFRNFQTNFRIIQIISEFPNQFQIFRTETFPWSSEWILG